MKRIAYLSSFLVILSLLYACSENPRFDELDGFWQVQSVKDLGTGAVKEANNTLFISFEQQLICLSHEYEGRPHGTPMKRYIATFEKEGNTLTTAPFRIYLEEDKLAPAEVLAMFGMQPGEQTFAMQFSDDRLTLTSATAVIELIHY